MTDLEQLPLTVARKFIVRALREASEPIAEQIRDEAPDDPTTPGSQISENIGTNVADQTSTGAVSYIGPTRNAFFAGFHEFGTAFMTSRPFIAPAFEEKHEEALRIIADSLGDDIERELKK